MALLDGKQGTNWLDRFPWRLLRLGRSGGGQALGVLSVWVWWERFTNWRQKVRPVGPDSFLCYALSRYSGKERTLDDGTTLNTGDLLVELHFNNPLITRMIAEGGFTPWKGLRLVARDIGVLEELVVNGDLGDVRAMHGVTLFAAAGRRVGMETRMLPRSFYWGLVRYFMVGLIALYHPEGWKHAAKTRESLWPAEVWLGVATMRKHVFASSTTNVSRNSADEQRADRAG